VSTAVIETIRVRGGWPPFLTRHAARLDAACSALGLPRPEQPLDRIVAPWLGAEDRVVRVEVGEGGVTVNTRAVPSSAPMDIVIAATRHAPYPHKVVARDRFAAALEEAGAAGADDALLITADGVVAEGTSWSIFWWDEDRLATPPLRLGILPGVARARVLDLVAGIERECQPAALMGKSMFATNAVRGVVPIRHLNRVAFPSDPRTARLAGRFWPDGPTLGG
jgi:branched-subunit amino acid aminotransferase/4-amino-4-deoxychorismate lyase